MTAAQRTALLALLDGIWDDPDACVYADTQEEYDFIKEPFPAAGGTPSAASAAAPRQRAVAEVRPAAVAAPAGPAVNTARDAAEIQALIAACSRCGQQQERKMPFGSGENGLFIIMNAPQLMPALEKKLFRKESLELLQRMISAIGLVLEQCYITNMIKCEPSTALVQPSAMYAHCSEILEHELKLLSPRAVLVMGDMLPLARLRKRHGALPWHCTEHPVTLVKNPSLKRTAWETLKGLQSALESQA